MRTKIAGLGALGVAFIVAGGCGGSSDDGGGGGSIAPSELPALLAQAYCQALESCFGIIFDEFLPAGEDCVERTQKSLENGELSTLEQAIADGKVKYDGGKVQACLNEIAQSGCAFFTDRDIAACVAAVDGTVDQGGDCSSGSECKSPYFCQASGACPGTCAPRLGAGEACEADGNCQDGLVCREDTGVCAQPAAAGQSCEGASGPPCSPGMLCVGQNQQTGAPGTCQTQAELFVTDLGGDCNPLTGPLCKSGLSCGVESASASGAVFKCMEPSTGSSCVLAFPDMCPGEQYCDAPDQEFQGTCTALPGDGEPCADTAAECAAYARCENGTCRSLKDNGGSCQTADSCYSGACVGGQCVIDTPCN